MKQSTINEMRRLRKKGYAYAHIGARVGVSETTVRRYLNPYTPKKVSKELAKARWRRHYDKYKRERDEARKHVPRLPREEWVPIARNLYDNEGLSYRAIAVKLGLAKETVCRALCDHKRAPQERKEYMRVYMRKYRRKENASVASKSSKDV